MANSVDPEQTASSGAVWSRSALFAYVILSETLVFEFLGHLQYTGHKLKKSRKVNTKPHSHHNSLELQHERSEGGECKGPFAHLESLINPF